MKSHCCDSTYKLSLFVQKIKLMRSFVIAPAFLDAFKLEHPHRKGHDFGKLFPRNRTDAVFSVSRLKALPLSVPVSELAIPYNK